ncbi:MAG TPA: murein transglycosylase domain-containing protein [Candidatus Krumholzibacteria bacterium]|nr:murein transglycosylase domain-containing protein [Candidatus Krumholzibacteria bacterium]
MSRMPVALAGAVGAALLLSACSTQQLTSLARTKDPAHALQSMAEDRVDQYKDDPTLALADLKQAKAEYDRLFGHLKQKSSEQWGEQESETLPDRTRYVKYTEDYRNRVVVDWDAGTVLIEHLDQPDVRARLLGAVVTALLTPDDPGAVDLFSDREVELTGTPYLQGLVADQDGRLLENRADAERYAGWLVANRLEQRTIEVAGQPRTVQYVGFGMVNTHLDKSAVQYAAVVRRHSESTEVSRALVYAIIRIESAFNPYAVSPAPAYGMMQLVPTSGGRDAYRRARGQDKAPSKEYLFDADQNIELGANYLALLLKDTALSRITDPVSREYCAIAAYNTGAGNVFRTFSQANGKAKQEEAVARINAMTPAEVYDTLRRKLPYEETRHYIVKAVEAKKRYAAM